VQTAFSISLLVLAVFIFWSNPKEKMNQWCSVALTFFFFGVVKQAIMFEIIPQIQDIFGENSLADRFDPLHNIFTWIIYTLATPTMTVAGCYFGYIDLDKKYRIWKYVIFVPGILLLFFFSPLEFIAYQPVSISFWVTYTVYNLIFGILLAIFVLRGIRKDKEFLKEGSILKKKRNRKLQEALLLLPPQYIWFLSVFPVNLLNVLGLSAFGKYLQIWQINLVVVLLSIIGVIVLAVYGEGSFGIKIVPTRYSYTHKMPNDEFMGNFSHRVKSDTSYMSVLANKIKDSLSSDKDSKGILKEINGNIDELLSDIETLNNLSRKFNRYSNKVELEKKTNKLISLLNESIRDGVEIRMQVDENLYLECDKVLMIEVFKDIIENSIQAIQARNMTEEIKGEIVIIGSYDRNKYKMKFVNNGIGILPNKIDSIFDVGMTTKNKEFNSGLGLANCKKVISKHGGRIFAENNDNGEAASELQP